MTTVRRLIAPLCALACLASGATIAVPDCNDAPDGSAISSVATTGK